ncbi:MAG: GTPase domain-containing protein [Zoogloea sp.]|nr:GTPase domain-containing protein [Zoogloea sp.]MCA0186950.1 GTPase domain-containing protein [Pseudomonadota bacterium]
MTTINLSLVSHTNTGKTTLARSLIGRDVGEIRDEAHVTALAERYRMIETPGGDALELWDTPGFGDSARLVQRLRQQDNPVGWFLTEVWDRWRDRPFWSSQQALRNVREEADVVLYLVNASERPGDAGYVALEMEILAWLGKPVLVLLNQLGEPRPGEQDRADEEAWRQHLAGHGFVRRVLPLDAFARCWVQEFTLLDAVSSALPEDRRGTFAGLEEAWRERRLQQFRTSMAVLGEFLATTRSDHEPLSARGMGGTLRRLGQLVGMDSDSDAREQAMACLAERLEREVRRTTDQLIEIHGLAGRAAEEVLARVSSDFASREKLGEGQAAALGGILSGALSGLAADLAAGGLTLGGGALIGAVLGAIGSAGAAKAVNLVRGTDSSEVRWSEDSLQRLSVSALLRYLAVAHYGRGRGEWHQGEYPAHWRPLIEEEVERRKTAFSTAWAESDDAGKGAPPHPEPLAGVLADTALALLTRLYPGIRLPT